MDSKRSPPSTAADPGSAPAGDNPYRYPWSGMFRPGKPHPKDFGSALVVFLVALPLCLGIALASNAPLSSGLVAGIIGGVAIGLLSGSHVMVSGPAAGLTAVVIVAISELGSFAAFLPAVIIGGAIQIALGLARAGIVAFFVPSAVIKGMLSAIGIILVLKQIPHLVGYDSDAMGDEAFLQPDNDNTFAAIGHAFQQIQWGAVIVAAVSIGLLLLWPRLKVAGLKAIPAPLAAVLAGVALSELFRSVAPSLAISAEHLVRLPTPSNPAGWLDELVLPDWSVLGNLKTWTVGLTVGLVASIESLLSLEASDRIDPQRRVTSPNRELLAQGVGNVLSGLIGGLPVTGVIVRSSANVDAGARTRWSAVFHGLLLLLAVLAVPFLLNRIPLAALAAILLLVGYNLARPQIVKAAWLVGTAYFTPFVVTVVAILFTDLLKGVIIGTVISVFFILREHMRAPSLILASPPGAVLTRYLLPSQLTFLDKAQVQQTLESLPNGSRVELDGRECRYIDFDVLRIIHGFRATARSHGVDYRMVGIPELPGEDLPDH